MFLLLWKARILQQKNEAIHGIITIIIAIILNCLLLLQRPKNTNIIMKKEKGISIDLPFSLHKINQLQLNVF